MKHGSFLVWGASSGDIGFLWVHPSRSVGWTRCGLAAMARAAAGSAGPEPVWLSMQYNAHLSISLIFFRHQPYCAWLVRWIKGLSPLQFSHKKMSAQNVGDFFSMMQPSTKTHLWCIPSGQPLVHWSPQSPWLASAILYWPQYKHGPSKTETTDNALMFARPAGQKWSAERWELFGFHSSSAVVCFVVMLVVWWGNRKHEGSTLLVSCGITVSPLSNDDFPSNVSCHIWIHS